MSEAKQVPGVGAKVGGRESALVQERLPSSGRPRGGIGARGVWRVAGTIGESRSFWPLEFLSG
jgi:hypothetical protein